MPKTARGHRRNSRVTGSFTRAFSAPNQGIRVKRISKTQAVIGLKQARREAEAKAQALVTIHTPQLQEVSHA